MGDSEVQCKFILGKRCNILVSGVDKGEAKGVWWEICVPSLNFGIDLNTLKKLTLKKKGSSAVCLVRHEMVLLKRREQVVA